MSQATRKRSHQRTAPADRQLIITAYGQPSAEILATANFFKNLPDPSYEVGAIVIVPPAVYGVVQFRLYERSSATWVYAIFLEGNPDKINYFPEVSLIPINNNDQN